MRIFPRTRRLNREIFRSFSSLPIDRFGRIAAKTLTVSPVETKWNKSCTFKFFVKRFEIQTITEVKVMTKVIKRENWKKFFDELSRKQLDAETNVQVLSDEIGAQVLSEGLPFVGLTFDEKGGESKIELIVGSGTENHQTHNILNPKMVAFESTEGSSFGTLDIEDESETKTLIKFTQSLPVIITYSETEVMSTISEVS